MHPWAGHLARHPLNLAAGLECWRDTLWWFADKWAWGSGLRHSKTGLRRGPEDAVALVHAGSGERSHSSWQPQASGSSSCLSPTSERGRH